VTSAPSHEVDTVECAAVSPEQPHPFRELGLKDDEYQRIREILWVVLADPEGNAFCVAAG
jgi:phosphoribosylformylglycinamidine synthase